MEAGTEVRIHDLSRTLTIAQAKVVVNKVRSWEATQELEVARVIAGEKEKEVQQAIRVKLKVQKEAARLKAELEVAQKKM